MGSMSKAECRKFAPNIFNKSKCTNCFKPKDEHSEEALENNRASRKVAKCGYLFAAPDWDFSIPLNRTKRWQRRWFVLYDDGELTYAVDDHPETVPQAIIDMNRVVEVSSAEEVTGHAFSLALTAPDRVHFVKGTSREECQWWFDVLSMFPRTNIKSGRNKRNATFPGGKATTMAQTTPKVVQPYETPPLVRPRFHSCTTEPAISSTYPRRPFSQKDLSEEQEPTSGSKEDLLDPKDLIEPEPTPPQPTSTQPDLDASIFRLRRAGKKENRELRKTQEKNENTTTTTPVIAPPTERAYAVVSPQMNGSFVTLRQTSAARDRGVARTPPPQRPQSVLVLTSNANSIHAPSPSQPRPASVLGLTDLDPVRSPVLTEERRKSNVITTPFYKKIADVPRSRHYESLESLQLDVTGPMSPLQRHSSDQGKIAGEGMEAVDKKDDDIPHAKVRGDPDGCGLDPAQAYCSPNPLRRLATPVENVNARKGYLMKQNKDKTWQRWWFVLRGSAFSWYRDQEAEDANAPEGTLELDSLRQAQATDVDRNYGFTLTLWDGVAHTFSAVTAGLRSQWLEALTPLVTPVRISESELDDTEAWCSASSSESEHSTPTPTPTAFPPSPPINRTPLSKVKARDRSRSSSRSTSRRSTLDEFPVFPSSGDMLALQEKLREHEQRIAELLRNEDNWKNQLVHARQSRTELEHQNEGLRAEQTRLMEEMAQNKERAKADKSEVYKLRDLVREFKSLLENRNEALEHRREENEELSTKLEAVEVELRDVKDRLQRGIEENEILNEKLRKNGASNLQGSSSRFSSRKSLPRLNSLSDLTNIDIIDLDSIDRDNLAEKYETLQCRFQKAVAEIRALKRELRSTECALSDQEVKNLSLEQQIGALTQEQKDREGLTASRLQDLTNKLTQADKQVRQLQLRVSKAESKERRRSLSLKGRESLPPITQEPPESEQKVTITEATPPPTSRVLHSKSRTSPNSASSSGSSPKTTRKSRSFEESTLSFRMRRKSLDSEAAKATAQAKAPDSPKTAHRTPSVEDKSPKLRQSSSKPPASPTKKATPPTRGNASCAVDCAIVERLDAVRGELRLLGLEELANQLANVRDMVTSPANAVAVDATVVALESLLKEKFVALYTKREELKSRGEWNAQTLRQWNAEKLATELSLFDQWWTSATAKDPITCLRTTTTRDAIFTLHKMRALERVLGSEDNAQVAVDANCESDFHLQALSAKLQTWVEHFNAQSDAKPCAELLNLPPALQERDQKLTTLFTNFKSQKLQEIANLLAVETWKLGETTDVLVEEVKMRQAWNLSQVLVNQDLVTTEVRQAMLRMAQVYAQEAGQEQALTQLCALPAQQEAIATRCQLIEDSLRQEMEEAVLQLSNQYEAVLARLREAMPQQADRMVSDICAQLNNMDIETCLGQFSEIVAQKALIDGHLTWLQGEKATLTPSSGSNSNQANFELFCAVEGLWSVRNPQIGMWADFCAMVSSGRGQCPSCEYWKEHCEQLKLNYEADFNRLMDEVSRAKRSVDLAESEEMREKYQAEMEHLRSLTEKGMIAMESAHKRVVAELEEKHRAEVQSLLADKERALKEETQATLAALDAMRKAHEAEVQREVTKIQEEMQRKMSTTQDVHALRLEHERELEDIRQEILSLSEKYSLKCLESAALEQKVATLAQQVNVATLQINDLEQRNSQLRAHLEAELKSPPPEATATLEMRLRAKETQLLAAQEDLSQIKVNLQETWQREDELNALCREVGGALRADRPLRPDQLEALRSRLEDVVWQSKPVEGEQPNRAISPPRDLARMLYKGRDLTRSPSCPRLSGFLSLAPPPQPNT